MWALGYSVFYLPWTVGDSHISEDVYTNHVIFLKTFFPEGKICHKYSSIFDLLWLFSMVAQHILRTYDLKLWSSDAVNVKKMPYTDKVTLNYTGASYSKLPSWHKYHDLAEYAFPWDCLLGQSLYLDVDLLTIKTHTALGSVPNNVRCHLLQPIHPL